MPGSDLKTFSGPISTWNSPADSEQSKQSWLARLPAGRPAWVFAYGSLMWDPGFEYEAILSARIFGYHRRFCIYSHVYRGTRDHPGLVFGLDRGGSCRGRVFRIAPPLVHSVLGAIWDREMIYRVYLPRTFKAQTSDGSVECHTFVANPRHEQYAGRMDLRATASMIAGAAGRAGSNKDYLENTLRHLGEIGLRDRPLLALQAKVRELAGSGPC